MDPSLVLCVRRRDWWIWNVCGHEPAVETLLFPKSPGALLPVFQKSSNLPQWTPFPIACLSPLLHFLPLIPLSHTFSRELPLSLFFTMQIFFPTTIFVVNIILAVFRFVLVSAVGACFAIYAKYGGEYAKSVGWIRSSGYRGMVRTISSTHKRKSVPVSVKWALSVALVSTLAASFLDKGISHFINPASSLGSPTTDIKSSSHTRPNSIKSFYGWNFIVPVNGSAAGTMATVLNSSFVIRDLDAGQRYTPITSTYSPACTDFGIVFADQTLRKDANGCGTVSLDFRYRYANKPSYDASPITVRSPNRWRILFAQGPEQAEGSLLMLDAKLNVGYQPSGEDPRTGIQCTLEEYYRPFFGVTDGSGITAYPGTATTKCFFNNTEKMDITTVTLTSTRFHTGWSDSHYPAEFVRTNFVNESDDLLLAMEETVKITNVTYIPDGSSTQNSTEINVDVWAEVGVTNSTIDIYVCGTSYHVSHHSNIECLYGTIRVLPIKLPDDDILKNNRTTYTPTDSSGLKSNYMNLEYLSNNKDGTLSPISTNKMRSDTVNLTNYMAGLGYNFYADFDGDGDHNGTIYIQYEIRKIKQGLEVPLWVLVVAGILLLIGFSVWQLTDWLIGSPYTSSLYTIVRKRLMSYTNTSIPRLMRFQFQPLMFEDVKLLSDEIELLPADGSQPLLEEDKLLPEA